MIDARPAERVAQYFEALDSAAFERAADQFAPDVTYVHPPTYGPKTEISGRESLHSYFSEVRGEQPIDHHIERTLSDDDACAVVGYATEKGGTEPVDYFVAYAELDGRRIDYYIAGLLGMA